MAHNSLSAALADFPLDLIQAVAHEAERDADRVGLFLTTVNLNSPSPLPADFLLGLGAALRLYQWEQSGITLHLHAGLPSGKQALRDLLAAVAGQAGPEAVEHVKRLPYRVMALFIDQFAWNGRVELAADVTLDSADEDALLEGLADFLWAHRPT